MFGEQPKVEAGVWRNRTVLMKIITLILESTGLKTVTLSVSLQTEADEV